MFKKLWTKLFGEPVTEENIVIPPGYSLCKHDVFGYALKQNFPERYADLRYKGLMWYPHQKYFEDCWTKHLSIIDRECKRRHKPGRRGIVVVKKGE